VLFKAGNVWLRVRFSTVGKVCRTGPLRLP
jgi:hypothetical protein